ncbi:monoamine oxidase [Actinokineospora baliensis]|uniref:flavin monoamine oxidase family protein n=1 Tax=Actinokineospora baliensis TaxID=547056 RepID=UPI0019581A8A|nr:FAD-dependent oxidoreductase [Actinokineospora baliensis]MBM7774727.1 monoamine oxidase [Actinokineospora baliensis]
MGDQEKRDIAIVGGGVSGLYAAWRILTDARTRRGPLPRVVVHESADRVGGRLQTWLPLGRDGGVRAELGGMRFLDAQRLLVGLLPRLGLLDIEPFPVDGDNLRLLLRGRATPLTTPDPTERYEVSASVRGKTAGAVLDELILEVLGTEANRRVLRQRIGKDLPTDRREWDEVKSGLTWRGRGLWEVGFWNLISDLRDPETHQYLCDAFGYYSMAANWNSAEVMQETLLDFGGGSAYRTLGAGMQALPDTLARRVRELGGEIELDTRLDSFDLGQDSRPVLRLVGPHGVRTRAVDELVLGLPRRALELLAPSKAFDLVADSTLRALVRTVAPVPIFKLFLWYPQRWWERFGITQGRSVSDLPIRQTYYFAPSGSSPTPAGLLMASYDDARAVQYWQGLIPRGERGPDEVHAAMRGLAERVGWTEEVPYPPPHLQVAGADMCRHAKAQLARLHGVREDEIPDPEVGAFADWTRDPYGGGRHFWVPGVDVRGAMTRIKQPLGPHAHVYVVGEAYSGMQGWIEGALTATEVALQRYFALDRPQWLPADYYLGW